MNITLEGYPVTITKLLQGDLQRLQDHYLPLILDSSENTHKGKECRISKNISQRWDGPEFFKLWNDTILDYPYIQSYIDSYGFQFPFSVEIDTWCNVHNKYDHQQIHAHITTNVPAFSCAVILKQPNENAGQFVFRTPNISNHLKYLELDPNDQYPNTFRPDMVDGAMMIFPSCLEHYVEYNQTDESRIVFASNIIVKREGDIYG